MCAFECSVYTYLIQYIYFMYNIMCISLSIPLYCYYYSCYSHCFNLHLCCRTCWVWVCGMHSMYECIVYAQAIQTQADSSNCCTMPHILHYTYTYFRRRNIYVKYSLAYNVQIEPSSASSSSPHNFAFAVQKGFLYNILFITSIHIVHQKYIHGSNAIIAHCSIYCSINVYECGWPHKIFKTQQKENGGDSQHIYLHKVPNCPNNLRIIIINVFADRTKQRMKRKSANNNHGNSKLHNAAIIWNKIYIMHIVYEASLLL